VKVGAVVQARMSSARLPGKVLREVAGRPLLGYLLDRLARCPELDALVVATSTDPTDDPVERFCRARGVGCYRGALADVASRFRDVLDRHELDAFVRVSGDSPLLDAALVGRAVRLFRGGAFDLVTNVHPRSFPPGQSVEVAGREGFHRAWAAMREADEREHVTLHYYRHPDRFRIENFAAARDYGGLRLTVDTGDDLARLEAIVAAMTRPHWEYGLDDLVAILPAVAPARGARA
jgi:spore coat polysaccharide biosynthesis protein SpsF